MTSSYFQMGVGRKHAVLNSTTIIYTQALTICQFADSQSLHNREITETKEAVEGDYSIKDRQSTQNKKVKKRHRRRK